MHKSTTMLKKLSKNLLDIYLLSKVPCHDLFLCQVILFIFLKGPSCLLFFYAFLNTNFPVFFTMKVMLSLWHPWLKVITVLRVIVGEVCEIIHGKCTNNHGAFWGVIFVLMWAKPATAARPARESDATARRRDPSRRSPDLNQSSQIYIFQT